MSYTSMIHYGMDNNVMEMKDYVVLTLTCHGFIKTLNEITSEDIELRMCGNQDYPG